MHNNSPEQMPDTGRSVDALRSHLKLEGGKRFVMHSDFEPAGDQPTAIAELAQGIRDLDQNQVLLGATGTGKTFTMAKVIEETQRPAIILAPNKTLAAQLYGEFKGFFPENAVEYFVSYYDYYQPEAYVPRSDTYIEKESQINEQIDRMRHSATRALLERDDVIIVASVSCIYGIGSVETYGAMTQDLHVGREYDQRKVMADLVAQQYRRNDRRFSAGPSACAATASRSGPPTSRTGRGSCPFSARSWKHHRIRPADRQKTDNFEKIRIYANSHYVTPRPTMQQAMKGIKAELPSGWINWSARANCWRPSGWNSGRTSISRCWRPRASATGSRTIRATSPAARPANRPRPCSNTSPTTPSSSPTKATSPSRRSAACIAATTGGSSRWPSMVSACRPAWTTAP
jgi:excinuclease ABC subunit B